MSGDNKEGPIRKRFEGKTAIITGAAGDLGSTNARLIFEEGARVVLCDLPSTEPMLKQLVTELGGQGAIYVCGDVTSAEDVKKLVQRGVDEFGGIDILLHCAAVLTPGGPLQRTDDALFKMTQDVNVYGTFLMMKYVSTKMIEAGKGGVIVNVSSDAGLVGIDIMFAYCASKFAVSGMTRAAAKSLAKHNIRVCAVAPSILEGHQLETHLDVIGEMSGIQGKEQARTALMQTNPMGRFGEMKEVANTMLFLSSKEASYITGVVLRVDGGKCA